MRFEVWKQKCENLVEDNINEKEYNELERNIYEKKNHLNLKNIDDELIKLIMEKTSLEYLMLLVYIIKKYQQLLNN